MKTKKQLESEISSLKNVLKKMNPFTFEQHNTMTGEYTYYCIFCNSNSRLHHTEECEYLKAIS